MPLRHASQSVTPAHWSKDFVEHLRTVHFTLVALCLGLLGLALFPSQTEIQVAHDQASEILEVVNNWDSSFLDRAIENAVESEIATDPSRFKVTQGSVPNYQHATFDVGIKTPRGTEWLQTYHTFPPRLIHYDTPKELHEFPRGLRRPESLKEFQQLWDAVLVKGSVTIPEKPRYCLARPIEVAQTTMACEVRPSKPITGLGGVNIDFEEKKPDADVLLSNLPMVQYDFRGPASDHDGTLFAVIVLPVGFARQIDVDGQAALIERFKKREGKHGRSFKDAFRQLSAVDEPLHDSTAATAERVLGAEAKRTGEAFQAVGLTIPVDVAVRCGALLILGIQLYMWIHLHEFGYRVDRRAGFEVAWIGVYSSNPARVVFYLTLFLLPASTIALLSVQGVRVSQNRWLAWTILVASNLATVLVSYLIYSVLPRPEEATNTANLPAPPSPST